MLASELRLMCVLAHPDDESLGTGGALAKCAAEGVATYLVTATRGERGRFGDSTESPGPEIVGKAREAELLAAAKELGLREVRFLDYRMAARQGRHGRSDRKIVGLFAGSNPMCDYLRPGWRVWHPDHIAIIQLTQPRSCAPRSVVRFPAAIGEPHRCRSCIHRVEPKKWAV